MAAFAEGVPCWADAFIPDMGAGKRFYGELFGWTFQDDEGDRNAFTIAVLDGKPVAALLPKTDGRMPTVWNIYLASPDAAASAEKVRQAGGQVIVGPGQVGEHGTMLMAADPGGAVFGVWQAGTQPGFGQKGEPGSYAWTELLTRDSARVDPFYRAVFGYEGKQIGEAGGDFDYEVWSVQDEPGIPQLGRMQMGPQFPAELPSHFQLFFGVDDCDAAVAAVGKLGGRVNREPMDSPYGRNAAVIDDQGAAFVVIDMSRKVGEPPA